MRAAICEQPDAWPWSSHSALAGSIAAPSYLCTDELLSRFARRRSAAQARYRAFVAQGSDEALLDEVRGERLGDEDFLRVPYACDRPLAEVPRAQLEPLRRPLAEVFASEQAAVAAAYRDHGYSLREIGEHLSCHYSTVSRRLRREEGSVLQCKT